MIVIMVIYFVDGSKLSFGCKSVSFVVCFFVEVFIEYFDWWVVMDCVCFFGDVDVVCCVVDVIVCDGVIGGGERSFVDFEVIFVGIFDYKYEIISVCCRREWVFRCGEGVVSCKLFDRWKYYYGRIRGFCVGLLIEN